MHGIGPTVQPHRRYRALRAAIENRFPVANAFLRASPGGAHGYGTPSGETPSERGLRSSVVQVESGRACRHSAALTTDRVERSEPRVPSAMDMTGLAVKPGHRTISRSDTRDSDRMLAGHGLAAQRDPPGCRRRATGAVKKTARSSRRPDTPAWGKTSRTAPACKRAR